MGEIAVVTGNLHDVALSIEPKTLDHHVAILPGVVDPTCGVAGEVSVVAEDCLRRCELLQLGKQAHAANPNLQRIEHFTNCRFMNLMYLFASGESPKSHIRSFRGAKQNRQLS